MNPIFLILFGVFVNFFGWYIINEYVKFFGMYSTEIIFNKTYWASSILDTTILYAAIFIVGCFLTSQLKKNIKKYPCKNEYKFYRGYAYIFITMLIVGGVADNIKYLGSVPAPYHLEITSYASIGIMSYDPINLNNLYCAPNKVWEYSGFGIPFLANDSLSLLSLVSIKIGKISTWKESDIVGVVENIMFEYLIYSENSNLFYESFNLLNIINKVMD